MAEDKNPKDLDGDGTVTEAEKKKYKEQEEKKERKFNKDTLERDLMNSEFGWAAQLIFSNDTLKKLWNTAIDEGWDARKFITKFRDTNYYQKHLDSWLKVEALKKTKPAAYRDAIAGAGAKILDEASSMGIQMTEAQARELADTYLRRGYNDPNNQSAYREWLAKRVAPQVAKDPGGQDIDLGFMGTAGEIEGQILATLSANGFDSEGSYWKEWVNSETKRIIAGNGMVNDAIDYIRRTAASKYPPFADDMVAKGKNLQDYANGYIQTMSEVLEIDPSMINLKDPYIRKALTGTADKDGKQTPMTQFDFEVSLRKDPRWQYTKGAKNEAADMAYRIGQMFGMVT